MYTTAEDSIENNSIIFIIYAILLAASMSELLCYNKTCSKHIFYVFLFKDPNA